MSMHNKAAQRYQRIHEIFSRRRGKEALGIKLNDLAEAVSIGVRQLSKDIKYLQEMGAPLVYVPSLRAWKYEDDKDFHIIEGQFINDEDATHLRIALETIKRINTQGKALGALPEVFHKIYKASRKWKQSNDFQKIIYFDPLPHYEGSKHLSFFLRAIEESRRITFEYHAFHADAPKSVLFDPWFLRYYDHRWYVGGYSHDPLELFVRVFPLERIVREPEIVGFCHDKPRDYDASTYWQHIYGISVPANGKVESVVLKFSVLQGKYFVSSPFYEPYTILESNEQHLLVRLDIMINTELLRKIASFGDSVKIIEPVSLQEAIRDFLKKGFSQYEE